MLVVKVAAGVAPEADVYNFTVLPELPADHQNPTYLAGVNASNVRVRLPGDGAEMYLEGEPPTVGVSDVVVAPPHTDVAPSATVQVPEKVPTVLAGNELHEDDVHELNVSMDVPYELGGP